MEAARGIFEPLSREMMGLLERFGNPLDVPVRIAFCPMAMGSKGASWVQLGEVVDNAYFGRLMRTCGEIRQTVAPGAYLLKEGDGS
jgi:Cu(I)/Ag(I) efflux system membrane fusion protein